MASVSLPRSLALILAMATGISNRRAARLSDLGDQPLLRMAAMGFLTRLLGRGDERGYESAPPRDEEIVAGLFLAPPDEVDAWDMAGPTPNHWPAVEFKHLGPVELGMLESIVTKRKYDEIDPDAHLAPLRDGGTEGPWVIRVRHELIDALSQLTPEQTEAAARAWAKTEEMAWPWGQSRQATADLVQHLTRVVGLSRQSRATGQPLFLLMSL